MRELQEAVYQNFVSNPVGCLIQQASPNNTAGHFFTSIWNEYYIWIDVINIK